ncbi:hypothetical protein P8452_60223 [Trifolium repens]|nr:hypothetical protein P8452_60223 [Trifolium repens]
MRKLEASHVEKVQKKVMDLSVKGPPAIISSSLTSLEEEKLLRVFRTQEKDKKKNKVETTSKYPPRFGCMVSKARNVKHTFNFGNI